VPPRLFSLEEAKALLPGIRDRLAAIQAKKSEVDRLSAEMEGLIDSTKGNGHSSGARLTAKRAETERSASDLDRLLSQIQELGCELKGIEEGLVDFRSMRGGRVVYLCWKLGEDDILYWHELDTGFAGRQPL